MAFLPSDDVSHRCPGKTDYVSVKDLDGKRRHRQTRYLLMTLSEAHQLLCSEYGNVIGFTKFSLIHPTHIRPVNDRDHEVCMCRYHENVGLLVAGLRKVTPRIPSDPVQLVQLVQLTVCDLASESCADRCCDICGVDDIEGYLDGIDE